MVSQIKPFQNKISGRGELLVSLYWLPAENWIRVIVPKARNLPKMDVTGLADPYIEVFLTHNNQRVAKRKSHVKKRTLNPIFNESFVFELPQGVESLDKTNLEILLLNWDGVTKNEVIGCLQLGGANSSPLAQHHWNEVSSSPMREIVVWHELRECTTPDIYSLFC